MTVGYRVVGEIDTDFDNEFEAVESLVDALDSQSSHRVAEWHGRESLNIEVETESGERWVRVATFEYMELGEDMVDHLDDSHRVVYDFVAHEMVVEEKVDE